MLYGSNSTEVKVLLNYLKHTSDGRDSSWWNFKNKKILGWSIIPNVAYSCMQEYGKDVRLVTRCYIEPEYRTKNLQQQGTYVFKMIEEQIDFVKAKQYNNAFISTEYTRHGVIKRHSRIAKEKYNLNCEVLEGKYKTCNGNELNCHQNIGLYRLSDKPFGLPRVE